MGGAQWGNNQFLKVEKPTNKEADINGDHRLYRHEHPDPAI
jgi:hypothetical protein